MILPRTTAHAVDEVVDLINKGLEHWPLISREKRQELAQRAATGLRLRTGKGHEPRLAGFAVLAGFKDLLVDDGCDTQHQVYIAPPEVALLLVEKREQAAVGRHFLAE
jgi:hypothetical protein